MCGSIFTIFVKCANLTSSRIKHVSIAIQVWDGKFSAGIKKNVSSWWLFNIDLFYKTVELFFISAVNLKLDLRGGGGRRVPIDLEVKQLQRPHWC